MFRLLMCETPSLEFTKPLEGRVQIEVDSDLSQSEFARRLQDFDGAVVPTRLHLGEKEIASAPRLKWIGRLGTGLDHIDLIAAQEAGIPVEATQGANANAVGDHTLGMILGLLKNITRSHVSTIAGNWVREEHRGRELDSMTVGIVGFGNTGRALARRLRGFNCEVLAHDKYISGFSDDHVIEATLTEICERANVLSIHIPGDKENVHWFNDEMLNRFKSPFFLINTSRGNVADTQTLISGLESGKILGAGLDVFEKEPITGYDADMYKKITYYKNVIMTSHIAGWSVESRAKMSEQLALKLLSFL